MGEIKRNRTAVILNILLVIFETYSCGSVILRSGAGGLIPFTVLSNLFTLAASLSYLLFRNRRISSNLRFASAVSLALTFLVVVFLLIPMQAGRGLTEAVQGMLFHDVMPFHHLICPWISVISFIFFEEDEIKKEDCITACLPMAIYAVVIVICNILRIIEGPYPFLRVYDQPIYMTILYAIGIPLFTYGIARLIFHTARNSNSRCR